MPRRREPPHQPRQTLGLKFLAEYLDLSTATISVVLNDSPTAREIPAQTRERVLAAARKFNYRPYVLARSLRERRSFTVGVLVHEISEGYGALLLNGIDAGLLQEGYFYFVASHRRRQDLLDEYPRMLVGRSVEGFIVIDTLLEKSLPLPAVNISGHTRGVDANNNPLTCKSTEHNIDAFALFTMLARLTGDSSWSQPALHARTFRRDRMVCHRGARS